MDHQIAGVVKAAQWRGDNVDQMRKIDPECGTTISGHLQTCNGLFLARGSWLVLFPPKSVAAISAEAFKRLRDFKTEEYRALCTVSDFCDTIDEARQVAREALGDSNSIQ